jgi:Iron-containing redox enzyme
MDIAYRSATESDIYVEKVKETEYTLDNPIVIEWTEKFRLRARINQIFDHYHSIINSNKAYSLIPKCVGLSWKDFSAIIPWVLSNFAAKVNENVIRHYIVQGLFEELGYRNVNDMHSKLFLETLSIAGLKPEDIQWFDKQRQHFTAMNFLEDEVNKLSDTAEILGFGLGLEIPAIENIESVFSGLSSSENISNQLSATKFFKIHRKVEEEHIRLHVSLFLRFCKSDQAKDRFMAGFDKAIYFWTVYWKEISNFIKSNPSK